MVLETLVYLQFNHLMQLVASESFTEGLSKRQEIDQPYKQ